MKLYRNSDRTKAIFYNPHIKLWTLQHLDAEGSQVGAADYHPNREFAFTWLAA